MKKYRHVAMKKLILSEGKTNNLLLSPLLGYTFAMETRITKEEALEYKRRWEAVNEAEILELRKTTVPQRLQQLLTLMASGKVFIVQPDTLHAEEIEVRRRWNRLRKAYNVSK